MEGQGFDLAEQATRLQSLYLESSSSQQQKQAPHLPQLGSQNHLAHNLNMNLNQATNQRYSPSNASPSSLAFLNNQLASWQQINQQNNDDLIFATSRLNNRDHSFRNVRSNQDRAFIHASLENLNSPDIYNSARGNMSTTFNHHQHQLQNHLNQVHQNNHQMFSLQQIHQNQLLQNQQHHVSNNGNYQNQSVCNQTGHKLLQNQQHRQNHNHNHYANFVLSIPPPNTVINQCAEQDLAAVAMGPSPPRHTSILDQSARSSLTSQIYTQSHDHNNRNHTNQNQLQRQQQILSNNCKNNHLLTQTLSQNQQTPPSPMRRANGSITNSNILQSSASPIRSGHSTSSLSLIEDKLQNEIKKLQAELKLEKEKNEALNSQLNINSSLMGAFEQSLGTLNTRLRIKDKEIIELRDQVAALTASKTNMANDVDLKLDSDDDQVKKASTSISNNNDKPVDENTKSQIDSCDIRQLESKIEQLKRQLVEKDRQLTDMRLEALNTAHQMEQLESKIKSNGNRLPLTQDYGSQLLMNDKFSIHLDNEEPDEGVMLAAQSPSDSNHAHTDASQASESSHSQQTHQSFCSFKFQQQMPLLSFNDITNSTTSPSLTITTAAATTTTTPASNATTTITKHPVTPSLNAPSRSTDLDQGLSASCSSSSTTSSSSSCNGTSTSSNWLNSSTMNTPNKENSLGANVNGPSPISNMTSPDRLGLDGQHDFNSSLGEIYIGEHEIQRQQQQQNHRSIVTRTSEDINPLSDKSDSNASENSRNLFYLDDCNVDQAQVITTS